jgi:hypothetical protein
MLPLSPRWRQSSAKRRTAAESGVSKSALPGMRALHRMFGSDLAGKMIRSRHAGAAIK